MSEPFLGEIRMVGCNFAPVGWAFCNGALVPISQNEALFYLLGTTFGGDGQVSFGLPNYCSRTPVGMGTGPGLSTINLGQAAGQETVTILSNQLPAHTHLVQAATEAGSATPTNAVLAASAVASDGSPVASYAKTANTTLSPLSVSTSGGSQPLDILTPFLGTNFIIAMEGIFPSQS